MVVKQLCHTSYIVSSADDYDDDDAELMRFFTALNYNLWL